VRQPPTNNLFPKPFLTAGQRPYLGYMRRRRSIALYPRLLLPATVLAGISRFHKRLLVPYGITGRPGMVGFGICLALLYFIVVYRMFREKVVPEGSEYGR
jgi:hypothetical protein